MSGTSHTPPTVPTDWEFQFGLEEATLATDGTVAERGSAVARLLAVLATVSDEAIRPGLITRIIALGQVGEQPVFAASRLTARPLSWHDLPQFHRS